MEDKYTGLACPGLVLDGGLGDEQHVDNEARAILGLNRVLPMRETNSLAAATASAVVSTTSTSPMTGTGEKKCSPRTHSGWGKHAWDRLDHGRVRPR